MDEDINVQNTKPDIQRHYDLDSMDDEESQDEQTVNPFIIDFFSDKNIDYINANAYPVVPCPKKESLSHQTRQYNQQGEKDIAKSMSHKYIYVEPSEKAIIRSCDDDFNILMTQEFAYDSVEMSKYTISSTSVLDNKDENFSKSYLREDIKNYLNKRDFQAMETKKAK